VHLGRHDGTGEDTATDGDHAGERALLVDVGALNGGLWGTETQTDILIPSPVASVLAGSADLVVQEDVRLSRSVSIVGFMIAVVGQAVPASGRRAPTGHCFAISTRSSSLVESHNVRELGSHGCGRVVLSVVFRRRSRNSMLGAGLAKRERR